MTPFQTLGQIDALKPIRRAAVSVFRPSYTRARPVLAIRSELPMLLNRRGLLGVGAEVGVKRGHFSQDLLSSWRGAQLISIDPWMADPSGTYHDKANVMQEQHDAYFAETMERLRPFGARSAIWRMLSTEAAAAIDPGRLDFVYIDARHDYDSVLEDLGAWFPLVRPGGVIAGHDYIDGLRTEGEFGVRRAVDGFFADQNLRVTSTFADSPWPSWLVVTG